MATLFMDPCDNWDTDQLMQDRGWFTGGDWSDISQVTTGGRWGGGAIRMATGDNVWNHVTGTPSTAFIGFSMYLPSGFTPLDARLITAWGEYSGVDHGALRWRSATARTLQFYTDAAGDVGSASTYQVPQDQWVNVQIKIVIADSGSLELKIDGVQILNVTGIDTRNGGSGHVNAWGVRGPTNSASEYLYFDDIAFWDTTGDEPTDFLPDFGMETIRPNAEGSQIDFTPSTGTDNSALVDEAISNSDTDYNQNGIVGEKDRLDLASMTKYPTQVLAVQAVVHAKKTDSGARSMQVGVYSGATEGLSSAQALAEAYAFYLHLMTDNPDDSLAWELADLTDLELQYETA